MVEGTSLENWQRRKAFVGSNPTLSARDVDIVSVWFFQNPLIGIKIPPQPSVSRAR